jgi:hypothetical protein
MWDAVTSELNGWLMREHMSERVAERVILLVKLKRGAIHLGFFGFIFCGTVSAH